MLDTFLGLPVHALIVHATVVVLPVTAVVTAAAAVHRRFRAWVGAVPPVLAVLSVVLVQLTTMSGNRFYDRFRRVGPLSADLQHHRHLGQMLILFVIPLAIIAVVAYLLERRRDVSKAVVVAVAVLAVVFAGAVLVDVALIGHAGSKAQWKGFVDGTNPR